MQRIRLDGVRAMTGSDTGRAAGLAAAVMATNVVALVFTLVFTRVLGQTDYGSLAALVSAFIILMVPGSALQTTVAREVSGAIAVGDPTAGAGVRRWLRHLAIGALAVTVVAVLGRHVLASLIGVGDFPWAAAATLPAGAVWLITSVQRGALQAFQRYRLVGVSMVAEQSARLALALGLAGAGMSVTGAFVATPLSLVAVAIGLWVPLHRQLADAPHGSGDEHRLSELFRRAAAPIAALGLIAWLQDGNTIVVKHVASGHDAGAWGAEAVAAKAIIWVAVGLSLYLVPEAARRARAGEDARGILLRTLGLIAAIAVPMVLVYAVATKIVLHVALHVKGGSSVLPLLGIALSLLALTYLCAQYQLSLHRWTFIGVLAAAGVAQPLILLGVGKHLTSLALGLVGVQLALAAAMAALAFRAVHVRVREPMPEPPPAAVVEA